MVYVATDANVDSLSATVSTRILHLPPGISIGQKFSDLRVKGRVSNDAANRIRLACTCSCGRDTVARVSDLRTGHTKSCGCLKIRTIRWKMGKLAGRRVGNLFVFGKADPNARTRASTKWVCCCVYCPRILIVKATDVRKGRVCPCLADSYSSWRNMKQRCLNLEHPQYKDYGGRGIAVSEQFVDFSSFAQYMGPRPIGTSLDRIDFNGPYAPGNCRWSDAESQAQNRRPRRK